MENRPRTSSSHEDIDNINVNFEGILDAFKKALEPKEWEVCVSYDEVQEALNTFLTHTQAIYTPYVVSIKNALRLYNKTVMDHEQGNRFIGLQGYIKYIQWHIIEPLQEELVRWVFGQKYRAVLMDISQVQQDIMVAKEVIKSMKKTQTRIDLLLRTHSDSHENNLLRQEKWDVEIIIKNMEDYIRRSEAYLSILTGKRK